MRGCLLWPSSEPPGAFEHRDHFVQEACGPGCVESRSYLSDGGVTPGADYRGFEIVFVIEVGHIKRSTDVGLDSNDYSGAPSLIGRRIEVVADLGRVRAFHDGQLVADHKRVWAWHRSITDPEHRRAAGALRRARGAALRPVRGDAQIDVAQRSLADYDAALGVDVDGFAS